MKKIVKYFLIILMGICVLNTPVYAADTSTPVDPIDNEDYTEIDFDNRTLLVTIGDENYTTIFCWIKMNGYIQKTSTAVIAYDLNYTYILDPAIAYSTATATVTAFTPQYYVNGNQLTLVITVVASINYNGSTTIGSGSTQHTF